MHKEVTTLARDHRSLLAVFAAAVFLVGLASGSLWAVGELGAFSGTANTIAKFSSAGAITNSAVTDDGTTLAVAVNKFTVTEANGNTSIAGTLGVTGVTTTTGGLTNPGAEIQSATISPAALVGPSTVNDYAPTGFATARTIRQNVTTGIVTLTGLAGGVDGRRIVLINISTDASTLKLTNEDGASAAANRFHLMSTTTMQLNPAGGMVTLEYDGASSRWRAVAVTSTTTAISDFTASTVSIPVAQISALDTLQKIAFGGALTPAAISGTNNDYSPTNIGVNTTIRQDVSSAATITGIDSAVVSGSAQGRILFLLNIATAAANTITLSNESGSSSAANRFTLPNAQSYVIPPGGSVILRYSTTATRWSIAGSSGAGANSFSTITMNAGGTVNNFALNAGTTFIEATNVSTLTGMSGGVDGRCVDLDNSTGSTITVNHLSASSSAGNRFNNVGGGSMTIGNRGGFRACFDSTLDSGSGAWSMTGSTSAAIATSTTFSGTLTGSSTVNFSGASSDVSLTGNNTHLVIAGTAPTLTGCGAAPSPSQTGGATSTTVTTGGGATGCVITWSRTFTTDPTCYVSAQNGTAPQYTHSATAVTLGTGTAAGAIYDVSCLGH